MFQYHIMKINQYLYRGNQVKVEDNQQNNQGTEEENQPINNRKGDNPIFQYAVLYCVDLNFFF